jgi:hypothetical protein
MVLMSPVSIGQTFSSSPSSVEETCEDCLKDNQDISALVFAVGLGIRGCTLSPAVGRLKQ